MDDIETMWVWVPRYSYTIGSEDGTNYYGKQGIYLTEAPTQALPGEIDVKFISKSEKDTGSAQYKVAEGVSNWRTPDAFTFGSDELSGIWVGKFETSSTDSSSTTVGEVDGGGNNSSLDAIILPSRYNWRFIQGSTILEASKNLTKTGNRYGFSTLFDSHAIKNDEWVAAAYLSQSKYGKLGNKDFSGIEKIVYRNHSVGTTGCSYGVANTNWGGADEQFSSCDYTYDVPINGTGASTTGNIYGIYDMSGGLWDIVMGNYDRRSGKNAEFNSGYSGQLESGEIFAGKDWLDDKYYNIYTSKDMMTACNGKPCISHGFFETQGWWQSCFHQSVTEEKPWIVRGGSYSDGIGIFDYEIIDGSVQLINYPVTYGFTTFRLALT